MEICLVARETPLVARETFQSETYVQILICYTHAGVSLSFDIAVALRKVGVALTRSTLAH